MSNNLKELRKLKGYTQEQVADLIGTSKQHYYFLEKGMRKLSQDWLEKISDALECTPNEILYGENALDKIPLLDLVRELERRIEIEGVEMRDEITENLAKVLEERAKK